VSELARCSSPRTRGEGARGPASLTWLGAAIILALWSGAASAQSPDCRAGLTSRQVAQLLFGRNIGGRLGVSEAEWGRFLDREISPRFPDGLTVLDAKGGWRDPTRKTLVHEPSKLVEIVLPGKPDDGERLEQIAAAYKSRFRQQSVGIVVQGACVSF
jgi:uncharacterized protein DUF3574